MERFDEQLSFELKEGYEVRRGTNDDGSSFFRVLYHPQTDEEGKETAEFTIDVSDRGELKIAEENVNLPGNVPASIQCVQQEMKVLFFTLQVLVCAVFVEHKGKGFLFSCKNAARSEEEVAQRAELAAEHLTAVLDSAFLDGEKLGLAPITAEMILKKPEAPAEEPEEEGKFPRAVPAEGQHSQLDFQKNARSRMGFLGGLVQINATGTEYSFYSVADMGENAGEGEQNRYLRRAAALDAGGFDLAEKAKEMSRLFRVDFDFFDAAHDREQEILGGMIQRASTYNGLRSFAWTVAAYCAREGVEPKDLSWETLRELTGFLAKREWLNYQADGNCPTLCGGDDIHVFYLPDAFPKADREALLKLLNSDAEDAISTNTIMSLEGLRRDLAYVYPAVKTIYDALAAERDPETALEGNEADVLYAWCAMAYAAREPIFTEDGPMNNWFQHPDEEARWEEQWRREREEAMRKAAEEWMQTNGKHLTRNPRISFNGSKFVFAGVEGLDNWLDILNGVTQRGGLHRSAVSGQTDYLVCNPGLAGDSKVKAALAQNIKGKNVKIILLEDLLKALGMEEKPAPAQPEQPKTAAPEPAPPPVRQEKKAPDLTGMKAVKLTYEQGLKAGNDDYEIDIPDGFRIDTDMEDRDFIAWLPNEEDPEDRDASHFTVYAGTENRGVVAQFRTADEYTALVRSMARGMLNVMPGEQDLILLDDPALPGGIIVMYDHGAVHANASLGVSDYLKGMRLLITGVEDKDRPAYAQLAREFFGRMRAKKPVERIADLDDASFTERPLSKAAAKRWDECVDGWIQHVGVTRAILQNAAVEDFRKKQGSGETSVPKLKKEIKDLLREIVGKLEAQIRKAENGYAAICRANPDNRLLLDLRASLEKLLDAADQSVTLDGQEMKVESVLAREARARLDTPEIRAMRKADEEKARAEKERARAEEEERKRLAEEQRKAEERQYRQAMADWEKEKQEVERARAEQLELEVKAFRDDRTMKAAKERDRLIAKAMTDAGEAEKEKADAEKILGTLGFFKLKEKREQRDRIQAAAQRIAAAEEQKKQAQAGYDEAMKELDGAAAKRKQELEKQLKSDMPLPQEPEKPASLRQREEAAKKPTKKKKAERTYAEIKDDIVKCMERDQIYSVEEIAEEVGIEPGRAAALLKQLFECGIVIITTEKRKNYYSLA